ncbi:nucleotide triphosphate diphosphatase NUDT15 [Xenorhabdus hominickii]|uniref:ADP-ribose pyrophosphatase n=1 Tax=Xenorhabdus hominickii TaxID=351679 RepID=A0A2G0QB96_XENHO|nr:NUDIX domain-containing protein [Xenorhabdus hominickii]AOM40557.1 ADP-ribose pyrophosphatase [Xenorhabdus hominickii]PHM56493.1 NADH pyrophosphatase [Xenorhabdus hominickii]
MSVVVGVGVIIVNEKGEILLGKRTSQHAPYWSIFGGHVDPGETFEECAIREIQEEIGITIQHPKVYGIGNNLETYREEGKHTVSVFLLAQYPGGEPKLMEPEKCGQLIWCNPNNLPEPHFEASRNAIKLWQQKQFYYDLI